MLFDCIVSQVHIPDFDVQGNLTASQKVKLVSYAIEHLRKFNPNSYIIITGHGHRPPNLDTCDDYYWEEPCLPLDEHGYVRGMPAQFQFVSRGLERALEKGYTRVLKTRGDCLIGIPNITHHCNRILEEEKTQLLITQQTGLERMGDCFMYGDLKLLHSIWHHSNEVHNLDGLQNTAINFRNAVGNHLVKWLKLIRTYCSFRDVNKLKFTCLRWNFHNLKELTPPISDQLLDPKFDFDSYHWGRTTGWHYFDADGNMSGSASWLYSEKQFYE